MKINFICIAILLLYCQCSPFIQTNNSTIVRHIEKAGEVALAGAATSEFNELAAEVAVHKNIAAFAQYRRDQRSYQYTNRTFDGKEWQVDSFAFKRNCQQATFGLTWEYKLFERDNGYAGVPFTLAFQKGSTNNSIVYSADGRGRIQGNYSSFLGQISVRGRFTKGFCYGAELGLTHIRYSKISSDLFPQKQVNLSNYLFGATIGYQFRNFAKMYTNASISMYNGVQLGDANISFIPFVTGVGLVFYPSGLWLPQEARSKK